MQPVAGSSGRTFTDGTNSAVPAALSVSSTAPVDHELPGFSALYCNVAREVCQTMPAASRKPTVSAATTAATVGRRGADGDLLVRPVDDHRELLAAVPRGQVALPAALRDGPGGGPQYLVADEVTVVVVEPLEVIEVDHDEREAGTARRRPVERRRERRVEPSAVCQPGQPVPVGGRLDQ